MPFVTRAFFAGHKELGSTIHFTLSGRDGRMTTNLQMRVTPMKMMTAAALVAMRPTSTTRYAFRAARDTRCITLKYFDVLGSNVIFTR